MRNATILRIFICFFTVFSISNIMAQSHLPNPERGLRFEEMARIPGLQFPWNENRVLNPKTWCKNLEVSFSATDGHMKVAQLYVYLTDFASVDFLSPAALDAMQSLFDGIREQGYKLALRYAYTYDGPGGYVYPPITRILGHLDQLKPIIQSNVDLIVVLQAGIIGLWGEWHNYNDTYNQADKDNLLRKLLEILPQNRQIMVRLPSYKNDANLTPVEKSRIGFHNDFFTDDQHVNAYAWGYLTTASYEQVQSESPSVMVEGEMPYEGSTTSHLNYVLDPIKSIRQLSDHHYNSLSIAHNFRKTFAGWKTMYLSKAQMDQNDFPYDPEYFDSGSRTVYDYVADHLGYRLFVDHANSDITDYGGQIKCNIKLVNYGFSSIHNPREVYLILINCANELVDIVKVDTDPSNWHTGVINVLDATLNKPINLKDYQIGIWMPDFEGSNSMYDARYAIRLCNSNTKWLEVDYQTNKAIGLNVLDFGHCDTINPDSTNIKYIVNRGSLNTSGYWQILDPTKTTLSTYIDNTAVTFENWMYFDDVTQMNGGKMFYNLYGLTGIQYGFNSDASKFIIQNGGAGRTVDVSIDYKNLSAWAGLTTQRWIHLALVVNENNWKIYLDGKKVYDQTLAGGYNKNTTNFRIAQTFKGTMAEVRVWNIARTETEIVTNMRKIISSETPGLLGRINFGEGSGATSTNLTTVGGGAWPSGGVTYNWGIVAATPTNIQTSEITSSGFTLTWEGGSETEYQIALTDTNTSSTTYYTTNSKSYTFTGLSARASYNVKVMSRMPLETEYSEERLVSLITSAVNKQQIEGIKLITNNTQWQITGENGETIHAQVYNLSGNWIGEYVNHSLVKIDISNFKSGVYVIKVITVEGSSQFKVIK